MSEEETWFPGEIKDPEWVKDGYNWTAYARARNCIKPKMTEPNTPEPIRNAIRAFIDYIYSKGSYRHYRDSWGWKGGEILFAYDGLAYEYSVGEKDDGITFDAWCAEAPKLIELLRDAGCYGLYSNCDIDID